MKNVAIIFAGGIGSRMTDATIPKQFLEWNGKAIIIHTLEVFENHNNIDHIVIACKEEWIEYTKELINKAGIKKVLDIVPGGKTALESQYNALIAARNKINDAEVGVLIHDGVRPLVDEETISKNIESLKINGNAITVSPAIETIITTKDKSISSIMDRNACFLAKAPQSFMLDDILEVHNLAISQNNHEFIDSASMMLYYGKNLYTVQGKPENIKVTTPSDYYMFLGISKNRESEDK